MPSIHKRICNTCLFSIGRHQISTVKETLSVVLKYSFSHACADRRQTKELQTAQHGRLRSVLYRFLCPKRTFHIGKHAEVFLNRIISVVFGKICQRTTFQSVSAMESTNKNFFFLPWKSRALKHICLHFDRHSKQKMQPLNQLCILTVNTKECETEVIDILGENKKMF